MGGQNVKIMVCNVVLPALFLILSGCACTCQTHTVEGRKLPQDTLLATKQETKSRKMRDFKLAIVQHGSVVGGKAGNLEQTVSWVRKAKEAGAEMVLFPELNITGHAGDPAMVKDAEPVPGGPSVDKLMELAAELDIYICAGIAEDDRGIHYNTQFIVGPQGYIGKQRKVHLSRDEYFYFRGGTQLPLFELPFARVGIIICYDNELPEVSRCLAVKGAEVLLCPHAARFGAWPDDEEGIREAVSMRKRLWKLTHACRAQDNGCFVALCNTSGRSAINLEGVEANHAGACMVFDPYGKLIAQSASKDIQDEMIVVDIEAEPVVKRRMQTCFTLQTRRPEVFRILAEPTF